MVRSDAATVQEVVLTDGTTDVAVTPSGQLHVVLMGKVDDGNSTSTPLGAGATFTGVASSTLEYGFIFVTVFSDVDSAVNGLSLEQSSDGVNWDNIDAFSIFAGIGKTYSIQPAAKFVRTVYTNGPGAQAAFRLQTILKKTSSLPSSHKISDNLSPEDDGSLGIAIIKGQNPSGVYVDFSATAGGNFKVSLEEYDESFTSDPLPVRDPLLEISRDKVTGESSENKYGRNIEIDSGVTADIWDGGYTVSSGGVSLIWAAPTAARIHTISSTSANDTTGGTGGHSVRISYLPDWDTAEATETVVGNLNAGIAMNNAAVMINRMEIIPQATATIINDGIINATAAVDGTITAQIRVGQGQTQMAIYGVPSIQKVRIGRFYANTNKAGGASGLLDVALLANTAPDVNTIPFITKHTFGLQTIGTSAFTIPYYVPKKIPGPAIIKVQASSNTNDMDVSSGFDFIVVDN